jgi:hypothetical protein
VTIPKATQAAVDDGGHFTAPWRNWLSAIERAVSQTSGNGTDATAAIAAIATALGSPDGSVENIPDQNWLAPFSIRPGTGISISGTPESGLVLISATDSGASDAASLARVSLGF